MEGVNLQRGMNYRLHRDYSIILMSLRPNAPYSDKIEENGCVLIYEGHDVPKTENNPKPKAVDQPMANPSGTLTQNGLFYKAAIMFKEGKRQAELVKVYEKIHTGIWAYNEMFKLVDAWQEQTRAGTEVGSNLSGARSVFRFRLEICDSRSVGKLDKTHIDIEHNRLIPAWVKQAVWKRDKGRCIVCSSKDNLHFDHIIPYSKGGSSLIPENIQLLCARHNIAKRDKIE
ncbi:HNH endonuclease [Chloroflexota bacterium]